MPQPRLWCREEQSSPSDLISTFGTNFRDGIACCALDKTVDFQETPTLQKRSIGDLTPAAGLWPGKDEVLIGIERLLQLHERLGIETPPMPPGNFLQTLNQMRRYVLEGKCSHNEPSNLGR